MFERGPFRTCPSCRQDQLGLLSVGGECLRRRCRSCRHLQVETLPPVDKKVIYLDQFAVSEVFKVKSGIRRAGANSQAFWEEAERLIKRVYLLQQAIFPDSNIHSDETLVSRFPVELRLAHEMLGGDVSFANMDEVIMSQAWEFFQAFIEGCPPPDLQFDVDDVLEGRRNAWLPDMHISTNMNLSQFADAVRASRDSAGGALAQLALTWAQEKPTFDEALKRELESYGRSHIEALVSAIDRLMEGMASGDPMAVLDATYHITYRQFVQMAQHLESRGLSAADAKSKVIEFWKWDGNWQVPFHRTSAYLFAAVARKMASGQKKPPSRGFFNDVNAVSVYGPYVDAIFLDNECAALLREQPLRSELKLRAKVFSMNTGDEFLDYLRQLEAAAAPEVRRYAKEAYGIV